MIIADAADHIIPGDSVDDGSAMMAVEQRLFYSAVTGATDLYLLYWSYWSQQRDDGTDAAPCRFIKYMSA